MKKASIILIGLALLFIPISIGVIMPSIRDRTQDIKAGYWAGNIFYNDYFGLQFSLPSNWEHDVKSIYGKNSREKKSII